MTEENPYIVKIYDCCKVGSNVFIMLEFCDGGCLEDIQSKRGGKLSEKDAKIILFQILNGLLAIH
jgi:serine/threonine protein kinase